MLLGWYDPNPKLTARQKVEVAMARYKRRWLLDAAVVLCSPQQAGEIGDLGPAVEVRPVAHCPVNTFMVGHDEVD
jgi:hypothetical protein